jgi:hypothetical protein
MAAVARAADDGIEKLVTPTKKKQQEISSGKTPKL